MSKFVYWVLYDANVDAYFSEYGPIGPRCTKRLTDAARFGSKEAAMISPAYRYCHPLMDFEPKEIKR
jgi:hypothetical protein